MRSFLITLLFACVCCFSFAQEKTENRKHRLRFQNKVFNVGATIGFNSAFPVIRDITIDEVPLENISLNYRVGVQASIFGRINMDRFFIQPSLAWQKTEGEIHFDVPPMESGDVSISGTTAHIGMKKRSLQAPVYVGYHIVREGPYALSFLAGPTLKYNYDVTYQSQSASDRHAFISESNPLGVNIGMGVSVQIWQLFFDFCYEFGLNQTESDFRSKQTNSSTLSNNIRIDQRTNVMSFSLGIIF